MLMLLAHTFNAISFYLNIRSNKAPLDELSILI